MTQEDEPESFLETFECVLVSAGLNKAKWDSKLGAFLVGQAQVAYQLISRIDTQDYNRVKNEILYQLDIIPKQYHQLFKMKKRREDKSPRPLLQPSGWLG